MLKTLTNKIVVKLSKNSSLDYTKLDDTVYTLNSSLIALMNGLYYEYYDMRVTLIPDEKNSVINKRLNIEYKIINNNCYENSIEFKIGFIPKYKINKESVSFTKININRENMSAEAIEQSKSVEIIKQDDDDIYVFSFKRGLDNSKEHIISMDIEYQLPISDLTHSFKLPLPCKKLNHNILISGKESNNWELGVNAFSSWFHSQSPMAEAFKVWSQSKQNTAIAFNNWSLPGAGYVISLSKKDTQSGPEEIPG